MIMTQEDKELLLRDLCARLPYGVKVNNEIQGNFVIYGVCENYIFARTTTSHADFRVEDIKPYLRPMSSMTEEEKSQYNFYLTRIVFAYDASLLINWLNAHHFDYRGLLKKGLAIDATGLNIY